MNPLALIGPIGLTTKLIVAGSILLGAMGWAGWKAYTLTRDHYENVIQQDKIVTVERTRTIAVLDKEAEKRAVAKAKAQWEADNASTTAFLDFIANNPISRSPQCTIGDDGLRLWNNENRGVEVR